MSTNIIKSFKEKVELNYLLYNSMFLTLPLDAVEQVGLLLPLLEEGCRSGLEDGKDPLYIIDEFFRKHKSSLSESEQISFLFMVIHYVERQIVLIDALEDAAYSKIHELDGPHSLHQIVERAKTENLEEKLGELLKDFGIRTVLTAHPTQFYPGQVLAIISDLTEAVSNSDTALVRDLLEQLGRTPFFKKQKPSPFAEAVGLSWYLREIFYPAVGDIADRLSEDYPDEVKHNAELIRLGFWPGGDRDGNPFVTVDTTLKVAAKLRSTLVSCYYNDIRALKRRLSFDGVYEKLESLEKLLYEEISGIKPEENIRLDFFLQELNEIEDLLMKKHQGLFVQRLLSFKRKVHFFGLHMASLDIRQDSRVIEEVFQAVAERHPQIFPADLDTLDEEKQIEVLLAARGEVDVDVFKDPIAYDTLASLAAIAQIQSENGEMGVHRYIISNCRGPVDMARIIALFRVCGWSETPLSVDIVPLFETIDDLHKADRSMRSIYDNTLYKEHLSRRSNRQTIMLGFSDGTKDGGYLMANWAIYTAKENITAVSRQCGVEVVFFDGRGGPPARGGGSTHLFYAAQSNSIENVQIQMTVQGQTISSHYGTQVAAVHNLEQLLAAGLENRLYEREENRLSAEQRDLMQTLASASYKKYEAFKQHPLFLPYLQEMSTLKYYAMANIGSRPSKRGSDKELRFEDLRAIPFVGAWSQMKQNVPGFYGLGSALKEQEENGNLEACIRLYKESGFFRALIASSMQSMSKTDFSLTQYMKKDPKFGSFWELIDTEFKLSKAMVLKISAQKILLEDNPRSRLSIALREKTVLPLLCIQQYALMKIQKSKAKEQDGQSELYEKMVMRSLFGSINASRNSV
jgi:phosphoenolpyruvate carboxylase